MVDLLEYLSDDSGDDTVLLLILDIIGASTHSVGLATASLTIGKDSRIIALEAGQNKIPRTFLIHLHLHSSLAKHMIKNKAPVFANNDLVILQIFYAAVLVYGGLFVYHRSHSHRHPHSILHIPSLLWIPLHLCLHHYSAPVTIIIIVTHNNHLFNIIYPNFRK